MKIRYYDCFSDDVVNICKKCDERFGNFYLWFLQPIYDEVVSYSRLLEDNGIHIVDTKIYYEEILRKLIIEISERAIRTLIVDIHEARSEHKFHSEAPVEQYKEYCDFLLDYDYLVELSYQYPRLFALIDKITKNRTALIKNCILRFIKDKVELEQLFNVKFDNLLLISISKGDSHNNGQKVIILKFDRKNIVYKPHSLSPENLFNQVCNFLNKEANLLISIKNYIVIDKKEYGWQQYIEHKEATSKNDVNNYFYRIGGILALCYMFGCDDLHHENIIACSDTPYIVDLETLLKNRSVHRNDMFQSLVMNEFGESVLGTMLLPTNYIFSIFDFDLGGISCVKQKVVSEKWKTFDLIHSGTSDIQIVKRQCVINEELNNLKYKGDIINPKNYVDTIINGFREMYEAILQNKETIIGIIRNSSLTIRIVLCATSIYTKFMDASLFPSYLMDDNGGDQLFNKFIKGNSPESKEYQKACAEIDAMKNGDIPYFFNNADNKNLCWNNGEISGYFDETLKEGVYKKIGNMSMMDCRKQEYFIKLAFSTIDNEKNSRVPNMKIRQKDILDRIENIAEEIGSILIWSNDGEECTCFTIVDLERRRVISPLDHNLYTGGGIVIFFATLADYLKNEKYRKIAEALLKGFELLHPLEKETSISAFDGIGSYMYLYHMMYQLFKEDSYSERLDRCCTQLSKVSVDAAQNVDFVSGLSGVIVLLCNLYRDCGKAMYKSVLVRLSSRLFEHMKNNGDRFLTGLAHGLAGEAWALIDAAIVLGKEEYMSLGLKLVKYENNYLCRDKLNWIDLRTSKVENCYWCYGAAGIGLSRLSIYSLLNRIGDKRCKELLGDIDISLKSILKNCDSSISDCLCHGSFGNLDILIEMNRIIDKEMMKDYLARYLRKTEYRIEKEGVILGDCELLKDYTFMQGIAGIAYTMIRILKPDYPSILALDLFK